MANDITTFRLSHTANDVANRLVEEKKFKDGVAAAKFGFAFAIKNYYGEFYPATYPINDSDGNTYNVGSFEELAPYVKALYPDAEAPYTYVRALIIFGLCRIGEIIDEKGMMNVSDLCKEER